MFISFEGIDGSGKTTQSLLLYRYMLSLGLKVFWLREPGGGCFAERAREMLLSSDNEDFFDPVVEVLVYNAARYDNFVRCVRPLLASGYAVICDRFIDSTLAYQGYGLGVKTELINNLHSIIFGEFFPDFTLILNIDVEESSKRAFGKYEDMGVDFMSRVHDGYVQLFQNRGSREIHLVNGSRDITSVFEDVLNLVRIFLNF